MYTVARRFLSQVAWVGIVIASAAATAAQALEVNFLGISRTNNAACYDGAFMCQTEPLLAPGNAAMIDDYYVDTAMSQSGSVNGDWFGIRSTSPSGVQTLNTASQSNGCWVASFTSPACPASYWVWWHFATRVYGGEVGQWRIEVLNNGTTVHTEHFQLVPYTLAKDGGDGQSVPTLTTVPRPLTVSMKYPDGTPAAGKSVTFKTTSKPGGANPPGGLSQSSTYSASTATSLTVQSGADGIAKVYFDVGGKSGSYGISATSTLAPGTAVAFTVSGTGTTDANDAANKEKGLGVDPAGNSSCASATNALTANPINIASGNKVTVEADYAGTGPFPLALTRYYNSIAPRAGSFGNHWRSFYDRAIVVSSVTAKGKTTTTAEAVRHDGKVLRFTLSKGAWVGEPDVVDRLESLPGGGYRFTCGNDQAEQYSAGGRLLAVAAREGFAQSLAYDAQGRLAQVTDAFGRSLAFTHDGANRVLTMTDPAGEVTRYTYATGGQLVGVQFPDGTRRQYHYENGAFPNALTGITDENQVRLATYTYGSNGKAIQSTRSGGALATSVLYYSNGTRDVLDALGNYRRYGFAVIQGVARRINLDNAACVSCGYATTTTTYSSNGFVSAVSDYRGVQTTFVRDARGLETSRTEAAGTSEARTITTAWHATLRVPLLITQPGRSTAFTYDNAGRLLTRTEADTVTGATRRWTHAYNAMGLPTSVDGPRTDVPDVSTFTYTPQGNLASAINALGHVTRFDRHDAHGRPLSMTDPNGLVTTFAYDLRGRLLERNAGGRLTRYSYTPAGQLLRTTHPDGSWIERQYDSAQQLVGLLDSAGQRIAYAVDAMGQRTREEHFDAASTSSYLRGWSFDALGRITAELDAQGATLWRHAYDANGNRSSSADALGQTTTRSYDALNRLGNSVDPTGAATAYFYDARDNLVRVTDPRGVATHYTFDGLDNLIQETSPDSGTSAFTHDAAGNVRTRTWGNGRAVTFTLDALNRTVVEDYGSGILVSYAYDTAPNGIGRLGGSSDGAGGNAWAYDAWGRVTLARRSTGARVLDVGYTYDAAGRVASVTYPSGRLVGYAYDGAGRIAAMTVDGQPLLAGISWQPFASARGWVQGNGRAVGRSFDRDGRLTAQTYDIGTRGYAYDAKGRIRMIDEPWGGRVFGYDPADRLVSERAWSGNWSYSWDGNGNRTSQDTPFGSTSYAYLNGTNRIESAAGLDARSFAHDAAGNMTVEGGYSYVYDARNRLARVQSPSETTDYRYDAMGRRVIKTGPAGTRHYAHDEQRRVLGEYDGTGALTETVWLGATPVAVLRAGATYWIDADQIDTPRVVRDVNDQIVWRWRSEAFGTQQVEENPTGLDPFEFSHRFQGQLFDAETALHHNDHRDYRAHTGRYVQADPIGLDGGINPFAYAEGDPVAYSDPLGLETYRCRRPLNGKPGRDQRNGPDVWGNVSYHQYSCVRDPHARGEGFICGGQGPAASSFLNFLYGPGKPTSPSQDYFHPEACTKTLDDNACVEQCLIQQWAKPRPMYGWPTVGKDCKDYDNDVNVKCQSKCGLK